MANDGEIKTHLKVEQQKRSTENKIKEINNYNNRWRKKKPRRKQIILLSVSVWTCILDKLDINCNCTSRWKERNSGF